MKPSKQALLDRCKKYAYDIKVLAGGVNHRRPYAQQLQLLGAINQASRSFDAAAAELESYAYVNLPRLAASKIRYQIIQWRKHLDKIKPN